MRNKPLTLPSSIRTHVNSAMPAASRWAEAWYALPGVPAGGRTTPDFFHVSPLSPDSAYARRSASPFGPSWPVVYHKRQRFFSTSRPELQEIVLPSHDSSCFSTG